jgi:hypothetical protein
MESSTPSQRAEQNNALTWEQFAEDPAQAGSRLVLALQAPLQAGQIACLKQVHNKKISWPEQRAIDSVQQALKAYKDIQFNAVTVDGQRLRIVVQLPSGYIDKSRAIATEQLAKAGLHLANLLNTHPIAVA